MTHHVLKTAILDIYFQFNSLRLKNYGINQMFSCSMPKMVLYYKNTAPNRIGAVEDQTKGCGGLKKVIIVCGHYGCGKTNLSLNLAIDAAKAGERVTLIDMDLVNPYFRSSEYGELLKENGVELIQPVYANSTLDIPAISPAVSAVLSAEGDGTVILDVGGDDVGATALGQFAAEIAQHPYEMYYVVNHYRPLSAGSTETVELLAEIQAASRLKATGVVNNSHLKQETTSEDVRRAFPYGEEIAQRLGLPLCFTTVPEELAGEMADSLPHLRPVKVYVRSPWE